MYNSSKPKIRSQEKWLRDRNTSTSVSGATIGDTNSLEKLTENLLLAFQCIVVACQWQKPDWLSYLMPLTGKGRGAYVLMEIDNLLE